jgi:hypothetical protein
MVVIWPTNRRPPSRGRRAVLLVSAAVAGYLFGFTWCARLPIIDDARRGNFPVYYYFSDSASWNHAGRVIFYPVGKPLELCGLLAFRNDLTGSGHSDPSIWGRMF